MINATKETCHLLMRIDDYANDGGEEFFSKMHCAL